MLRAHSCTMATPALLAAVLGLTTIACKKQPTVDPDAGSSSADGEDGEDGEDGSDVDADASSDAGASADAEDEAAVALNKANFDETVHDHFAEVSDCYVAALEGNPELAGKLEAEFVIGGDGQVLAITAVDGSTLTDEGLLACIDTAAAGWSFPAPADGEMTLRYTFDLAPG